MHARDSVFVRIRSVYTGQRVELSRVPRCPVIPKSSRLGADTAGAPKLWMEGSLEGSAKKSVSRNGILSPIIKNMGQTQSGCERQRTVRPARSSEFFVIEARESPSQTSDKYPSQLKGPSKQKNKTQPDWPQLAGSFLGQRGIEWGRWRRPKPQETKFSPLACGCFITIIVGFGLIETPFRVVEDGAGSGSGSELWTAAFGHALRVINLGPSDARLAGLELERPFPPVGFVGVTQKNLNDQHQNESRVTQRQIRR
ncbi:hypothetical protein BJX63DRAFT_281068 [Aspergillus granulosus]|uniref:Uncharacterized protein n=1 Tax=Aspergillus granulosus TaxID=176169 RepID=A0ABR4HZB7_9EURO